VIGLNGRVIQIAVGGSHTCALMASGGVKCWGSDDNGQLGNVAPNGFDGISPTPLDVTDLGSGVTQITAGYTHTCAVMANGGVKCWGFNAYGQLGDSTATSKSTPVDVIGLSGVAQITAGWGHTCAVTVSGGA